MEATPSGHQTQTFHVSSRDADESGSLCASTDAGREKITDRAAHAIMFWFLCSMAVIIFVPCVLVPVWVETDAVLNHERAVAAKVGDFEARAAKNDVRIAALLADPLVNERVIRRELNYRPEGERIVRLPMIARELGAYRADVDSSHDGKCESMYQDAVVSASRWLPPWPWRLLFATAPNRHILLLMAGGLLISAFVLYGPTRNRAV